VVLFLFLTHLGLGIAFTLAFVSRDAGVKFFRFNAGLAAILVAVAAALHPPLPAAGAAPRVALAALVVAAAALVVYWATVGRTLGSVRPALVWTWMVSGAVTLALQALTVPAAASVAGGRALTIASFFSSAAILGTACTAMILGHWYLVIPSMPVSHLQSIVRLHMASIAVRVAVVGAVVFLAIAGWQPGLGPSFRHYVLSVEGVFFWQRALFGLAGPALLSYLTWETAKIRSTQSATGILYVDLFTVIVGEALAKYILLATRVPV
jgi:protein NrfD